MKPIFQINLKSRTINEMLKNARKEHKLSQKEVAEHLGVHPQYVSNVERNMCPPSLDMIDKLSKLFNLDRSELVNIIVEDYKKRVTEVLLSEREIREAN